MKEVRTHSVKEVRTHSIKSKILILPLFLSRYTLSDKISSDKTAENLICCWKFCPIITLEVLRCHLNNPFHWFHTLKFEYHWWKHCPPHCTEFTTMHSNTHFFYEKVLRKKTVRNLKTLEIKKVLTSESFSTRIC